MSNIVERDKSFFGGRSGRLVLLLPAAIISTLIVDTSLTRISDIFATSFSVNVLIYVLISIIFGAGQFVFLRFLSETTEDLRAKKRLFIKLHKIVIGVQCGLTAILGIIIVGLVTTSQYPVAALIASLTISNSLGATMMLLLARHFFSWFRAKKDLIMLLYAISTIAIAVHLVFTFSYVDYVLSGTPAAGHSPYSNPPFFPVGSLKFLLGNIYTATSISAFVSVWSATALLLHSYARRIGKIKYWTIICLPLVYFLSQFPTFLLNMFDPLIKADPSFYGTFLILLFSVSKPTGGFFFGVAFWYAARKIPSTAPVRKYLVICAYGFILLFTADQGNTLINPAYPPFGLATISFMGLSSYLVLIGIFYTAISVSQDAKLRREIRKLATDESKLVESLSSAQLEQEIKSKLSAITKYHADIANKMGVQPSIDEEEARGYLDEVIKEKKSIAESGSKDE